MPTHGRVAALGTASCGRCASPCVTCTGLSRGECLSPTFVHTHHTIAPIPTQHHLYPTQQQQQQPPLPTAPLIFHRPSTTAMIVSSSSNSSRRSPHHHHQHHYQHPIGQSAEAASLMDVNGTYLCTTYNPGCIIMRKVINYIVFLCFKSGGFYLFLYCDAKVCQVGQIETANDTFPGKMRGAYGIR